MWWITTRVIRLIFEDHLDQARATPTRTTFGSDPHRQSTLVWGVIFCNLAEEYIPSKKIKYRPILVGAYAQWLFINSGKKEVLKTKSLDVKLKDRVDNLSDTLSSTTKNIIGLKTKVAVAKKEGYHTAIKVRALKKLSSGDSWVQGCCDPVCRSFSEEAEGGDTMSVSEAGGKLRVSRKGW